MRLDSYIVELLFEHDCVIVPDFGGLVATYRPARLHRSAHLIQPPSKQVGFNRHLSHNDGLLVNHIARQLGLNYTEALFRVNAEVAAYKEELKANGRIAWHKVGVFFNDVAGQLQFIPEEQENFLKEAYGLPSVQLKPVVKRLTEPVLQPQTELPAVVIRRNNTWLKVAAAVLPIAFAGALLYTSAIRSGGGFDMASLNPFHQKEIKAEYPSPASVAAEVTFTAPEDKLAEAKAADSTAKAVRYNFSTNSPDEKGIVVTTTSKALPKPTTETTNAQGNWEVIGGAFMFEDNADKFVQQLRSAGFKAHRAGTQRGLFLVAYGSYNSASTAEKALRDIRSATNPQAWLRKK